MHLEFIRKWDVDALLKVHLHHGIWFRRETRRGGSEVQEMRAQLDVAMR
jgi:hypothetical protein